MMKCDDHREKGNGFEITEIKMITWNVLMDERTCWPFNMCGHADLWCRRCVW